MQVTTVFLHEFANTNPWDLILWWPHAANQWAMRRDGSDMMDLEQPSYVHRDTKSLLLIYISKFHRDVIPEIASEQVGIDSSYGTNRPNMSLFYLLSKSPLQ